MRAATASRGGAGRRRGCIDPGCFYEQFGAAVEAAVADAGIAQVSDALAFTEVLDGKLQPFLTGLVATAPPIMLAYPGNRYLTAKA